jgi:hypothetical protein
MLIVFCEMFRIFTQTNRNLYEIQQEKEA